MNGLEGNTSSIESATFGTKEEELLKYFFEGIIVDGKNTLVDHIKKLHNSTLDKKLCPPFHKDRVNEYNEGSAILDIPFKLWEGPDNKGNYKAIVGGKECEIPIDNRDSRNGELRGGEFEKYRTNNPNGTLRANFVNNPTQAFITDLPVIVGPLAGDLSPDDMAKLSKILEKYAEFICKNLNNNNVNEVCASIISAERQGIEPDFSLESDDTDPTNKDPFLILEIIREIEGKKSNNQAPGLLK
ncbi:hypothetical protein [Piscirickettsia litoralis]|uniref:Uncharacterized protein n=1 Tax=Piscirickettsia litoralis TaxID=1891921 RepID=A0ABX3A231_9GAMM|nr:hypothetical protein [Piscirickettsia litoralis]ODN41450.1 hypothetical protein BGC07_15115 [Piscirickettsia litoralis]